ncbi:hypothetical protein ACHAWF_010155, partial [Thalassiosira exigua]
VDKRTPRVDVLDCSIYNLNDHVLGKVSTLVEPRIDHNKWHKWNANNGYVDGMDAAPDLSEAAMEETEKLLKNMDLGAIEEGSEDEEDSTSDQSQSLARQEIVYTPSEVAQAFSHFSYWATGRKRLICDLQGVHDEKSNIIKLSDPVIHFYDHRRESRRNVHGATDKGSKGIKMFFVTHECNKLCFQTINGFKSANRRARQRATGDNAHQGATRNRGDSQRKLRSFLGGEKKL